MTVKKLSQRFAELLAQADEVERSKRHDPNEFSRNRTVVDRELLLGWRVKCRTLLSAACGKESEHYREFLQTEKPQMYRDNFSEFVQLRAILKAAQEDYNGGYLSTVRSLVQAELFASELDQARELLATGYAVPAAVVAGVVLETTLRGLCERRGIPTAKLDKMNADLAKAGEYDVLVQKRITAIADVRNNAAHGHPDKFKREDVEEMISYVERFLENIAEA